MMKWVPPLAVCALALSLSWQFGASGQSKDVIVESMDSAVQIRAQRADGKRRAASGVALTAEPDGRSLILTAAHLLVPAIDQQVSVTTPADQTPLRARILAIDEETDVAILEVDDLRITPANLQIGARLGDPVWVVSFPWGRRGTLVGGAVSQIAHTGQASSMPLHGPVGLIDAAVGYGTSGGGVFDKTTGHLLGIVRGYRTAKLRLPGESGDSLEFPIAGETTVIPTSRIFCVLRAAGLTSRLRSDLGQPANSGLGCPSA